MQIIFAGKAHPADEPGKQLIKKIANLRHDPRFAGRIVFIEDYDINVCRHMIQGVDVWLNNPAPAAGSLRHQRPEGRAQRRPEPLDPRRLVGRSLRRHERLRHRQRARSHVDDEITDDRDAEDLHQRARQTKSFRCTTTATSTACRGTGSSG